MFHSKNGYPHIICSASLSIYDLLREKKDQNYISEDETKLEPTISNDAVALIKDKIDKISPTTGYWVCSELQLYKSEKLVPTCLKIFLLWLFDNKSVTSLSTQLIK